MRRNDIVYLVMDMSNVTCWRYWVVGDPSPRRGIGVSSLFHYPPYYLYFGHSRPFVYIMIDDEGYFVPPVRWELSWDATQWRFIDKHFAKRKDIEGLQLPHYLHTFSKFLSYIHKVFTLIDLLKTKDGELVKVVKEWTKLNGNPQQITFPSLTEFESEN